MTMSVRFCLSYDHLQMGFHCFQNEQYFDKKRHCCHSAMTQHGHMIFMTQHYAVHKARKNICVSGYMEFQKGTVGRFFCSKFLNGNNRENVCQNGKNPTESSKNPEKKVRVGSEKLSTVR